MLNATKHIAKYVCIFRNIGFPDTQQVQEINKRAGELHNQKRTAIEQEAK
jgi:hypothetical protein